jgi:tetratricopeptide (TPR) repeat protein
MDSVDVDLDDDTLEQTDQVHKVAAPARPRWIAAGTIAPPIGTQLVDHLERQIADAPEHARGALYKQLGKAWEESGRERKALEAWLAADRYDGSDVETLRSLARLYHSAQAWHELSETIGRLIDVGQLGEQEMIELHAQLGQLEGDVLRRVDNAVDAWRKVTALDASDFRALAALENIFVRERRWEESIEVLERRALVVEHEAQRRETLLQAAAIWEERLDDSHRAAEVYERVRSSDPANPLACERLEAIYREQRRWAELVEILLERSESIVEVERQIATLHQVATIYESELDDLDSAFYVVQAAFNRNYAHERAGKQLERITTATGRWQEVLDEYTNRVAELEHEDRGAAADLWVKIGRWYSEHLSHLDYALHSIQQALRIDPAHAGALAANASLQRMRGSASEQTQDIRGAIEAYEQALAHDPNSNASLEALDRLYRRSEAWEPLADILSRRARIASDDSDLVGIWLELGSIREQHLLDTGGAIAAYETVIDLEPANGVALRGLEALYEKTAQNDKYLAVLETQLAVASDGERVSLYERIAAAWEERFCKLDRAAEAYEHIVALEPRNYAAYHLLARMYQQSARYDELVATYRRHLAATTDVATRIELCDAMGKVCETHLQDIAGAIQAYDGVLSLDAGHAHALDALGRLYEKAGDWHRAVDVLGRLVESCDDARKPDLYCRIGRIQYAQLRQPDAAEASLLQGLELDPGHLGIMDVLTGYYADRGDWLEAAQLMQHAESHTELVVDKVRLSRAAADIYMYKLRDKDQAKRLYAAAIALDPEHVDAGWPLAGLYFHAGQWAELSPVIDMLCRKIGLRHTDPHERHELYYRAARCADERGEHDKALRYYQDAYEIDPAHLPTLIGRADLLFKMKDWVNAGALYQTILVERVANRDEAARIYERLGLVAQALGDRKKAQGLFLKALEIDPQRHDTLHALIDLHAKHGEWQAVVYGKRGLLEATTGRDKAKVLDEIGGIYHHHLHDVQKATAAYIEAVESAPDDRQLLQKLLDLCTETKQWKRAVATIERFVAVETDPFRRGLYFHAAATLCRDALKLLDIAVDYYDCALDSFFSQPEQLDEQQLPRALKSFHAIDAVLTTKRDWQAQERAYREMIKRLPAGEKFRKLQVGLLDALAEIYRSRLKQYADATEVLELAQQLDPTSTARAEILAELYVVAGPDRADKAAEQHALILRREPFKYDSYKALKQIYANTHQHDKLWCVCSTLAFLNKADPDELRFYEQYKPRGLVKAKRPMTADSWDKVAHRDENRYISAIFGACSHAIAALKAFPHKDFGIKREDRRQLEGDTLMFSKLFLYVGKALNVELPDVYLVEDDKTADIQLANAIEKNQLCPSFVARPHVMQGKNERELAFVSARRLAYMRPEYYLRMLLTTNSELKLVLLSAIATCQPGFAVPASLQPTVQEYVARMRKRIPASLDVLVQRYMQAGLDMDVAKWGHAVDAASHRVGFALCGSLEIAARAIAAEPVVVGGPTVRDKVREVVLFSISEELFSIRSQMGLAI